MNKPHTFTEKDKEVIRRHVFEQAKMQASLARQKAKEPTMGQKILSLTSSLTEWAAAGFKVVSQEQFDQRLQACKGCEFWDSAAMAGTGKCRKCGCSTQAKLRLATASCPVQKWGALA